MVFRVFFWRLLCVLALIGAFLQLVGFFLPYSLTVNLTTHETVDASSYWWPPNLPSSFILAFIVWPLIQASRELTTRPRSFSRGRLAGLIFALLALLQYVFWSFISVVLLGSYVITHDTHEYVMRGQFGTGFWVSLLGYLLSAICFVTLLMLGQRWWHGISHGQERAAV